MTPASHQLHEVAENLLATDEARGSGQVGQPVVAEIDEVNTVDQCRSSCPDQNLSAVCRRHDADRAVPHGAEVGSVTLAGLAGLESHPGAQP